MKTPQEKLVALMQLKQDFFNTLDNIEELYFTEMDKKCLLSLSEKIATKAVSKMIIGINTQKDQKPPLVGYLCPFCKIWRQKNCEACPYGKSHGICRSSCEVDFVKNTWDILFNIYSHNTKRPDANQFLNILEG